MIWDEIKLKEWWEEYFRELYGNNNCMEKNRVETNSRNVDVHEKYLVYKGNFKT